MCSVKSQKCDDFDANAWMGINTRCLQGDSVSQHSDALTEYRHCRGVEDTLGPSYLNDPSRDVLPSCRILTDFSCQHGDVVLQGRLSVNIVIGRDGSLHRVDVKAVVRVHEPLQGIPAQTRAVR